MNKFVVLLLGAAVLPACLYAEELEQPDNMELQLDELVVVSKKSAVREEADKLGYITKNAP